MSNSRFEHAVLETNAVTLMHVVNGLTDLELVNFEEWTFIRVGDAKSDDERLRLKRSNQIAICEIVRRFKVMSMNNGATARILGHGPKINPLSNLEVPEVD
jgi:hypothetical protein